MRLLVPVVKCDRCQEDVPADTRSTQISVTWPDGTVELHAGEACDTCQADLRDDLKVILAAFLVPDATPKKKKRPAPPTSSNASVPQAKDPDLDPALRTCPVCAEMGREHITRTRSALGQHLSSQHQTSFKQLGMSMQGNNLLRKK